jgi:glutamine amidotransferase-like uncharacterized protein
MPPCLSAKEKIPMEHGVMSGERKLSAQLIMLLSFALLVLLTSQCQNQSAIDKEADVALYSDRGVWSESVQAAEQMFQWMGYITERVGAQDIKNGALDNFRLLCVPGGNMYSYAEDLSSVGVENIRSFVRVGGGYLGICGGAYFAGQKVVWRENQLPMLSLEFFPGTAQGPFDEIAPYPDLGMCLVKIMDTPHPITQSEPDSAWILYYWGPALLPDEGADVTILGRYEIINQPALIALNYGLGRVFLIGTHPEIEEDSDRDGVTVADELDDRGSDWDLMRKATRWCLKE